MSKISCVTKRQGNKKTETAEQKLLFGEKDMYGIYRLKNEDSLKNYRFERIGHIKEKGLSVDKANYELIYSGILEPEMTVDSVYETLSREHPADFKTYSVSVSDVIVLHKNGRNQSHYVDSVGFQKLPLFLDTVKDASRPQTQNGEIHSLKVCEMSQLRDSLGSRIVITKVS